MFKKIFINHNPGNTGVFYWGYESMLDYYSKVAPQFNEPLYTRTAWFILSEVEGYSGVRGAPRLLTQARPSTRLCGVLFVPSLINIALFSNFKFFNIVSS